MKFEIDTEQLPINLSPEKTAQWVMTMSKEIFNEFPLHSALLKGIASQMKEQLK